MQNIEVLYDRNALQMIFTLIVYITHNVTGSFYLTNTSKLLFAVILAYFVMQQI